MRRLYSLDVLRGVAAIGTVLWHWQHFFYRGGRPVEAFEPSQQPLYAVFFLLYDRGWMGVDLFFCLSGFIFFWLYADEVRSGLSAADFALRRFARLYPLHLATLLAVAALQLAHSAMAGAPFVYQNNDWPHFGMNLLLANGWGLLPGFSFNGPVWSISIEVLMYASFFMLCRYVPLSPALIVLVIVAGARAVSNPDISRGIVGFFSGGLTYYTYVWALSLQRQRAVETVLRVAMVLAWSLTLIGAHQGLSPGFFLPFVPRWFAQHFAVVALFPLTILCLAIAESRRGELGRRLSFLGDASYSIYLWHFPLQIVFAMALPMNAFLSPITLAAFFACLLTLSIASHRLLERPTQRAILRAYAARKPPSTTIEVPVPQRAASDSK